MKIRSSFTGFLLICIFFFVLTNGALGPEISIAQQKSPESAENSSQPSKTTRPDSDPYVFNNLSESEQVQIQKKADQEKLAEKQAAQNEIADRLSVELKLKQEEIRLYEVILLTIMSLCALMIVLKCMKDSQVCNARDMINGTGLVLVIFSTVMVIILADAEIQLTAAMGVLGGIAGYLFGTIKTSQVTDKEKNQPERHEMKPE